MTRRPYAKRSCGTCGGLFDTDARYRSTHCDPCRAVRVHMNGRVIAAGRVAKAIREGSLRRADEFACIDCGIPATQYDHRDYGRPLAVEPVCARCNRRRGPGRPLFVFRDECGLSYDDAARRFQQLARYFTRAPAEAAQ